MPRPRAKPREMTAEEAINLALAKIERLEGRADRLGSRLTKLEAVCRACPHRDPVKIGFGVRVDCRGAVLLQEPR